MSINNEVLIAQINDLLTQEGVIADQLKLVQAERVLKQKVLEIWQICDSDPAARVFIRQVVDTYPTNPALADPTVV